MAARVDSSTQYAAVFYKLHSFCGCPYNKSPTTWGLYWGPWLLETLTYIQGPSQCGGTDEHWGVSYGVRPLGIQSRHHRHVRRIACDTGETMTHPHGPFSSKVPGFGKNTKTQRSQQDPNKKIMKTRRTSRPSYLPHVHQTTLLT